MNLVDQIKKTIRDVADFPKPGIMFKDISPILEDQELCSKIVDGFINALDHKPDAIVGIESRGFLFGVLIANKLNVPFIMVRKAGKLPYKTINCEYALEYGTAKIEMHIDAVKKGWNVVIHDDLLATGGTAVAAAELVKNAEANVMSFNFVVELDFLKGKEKLTKHTNNIQCLIHY